MINSKYAKNMALMLMGGLVALATQAETVSTVNGKPVSEALIRHFEANTAQQIGQPLTTELRDRIRQEVITRDILLDQARKQGLDATSNFKLLSEVAVQNVLIQALYDDFTQKNPVAEAELKTEYDKFVAANSGKQYLLRQIHVQSEVLAKDLIAKIKKGAPWDELAKEYSIDAATRLRGGEIGWIGMQNLLPEFQKPVAALAKGQTSAAPIASSVGFHILRLDDVREAQVPRYEELKPRIQQELVARRWADYQKQLQDKAVVKTTP